MLYLFGIYALVATGVFGLAGAFLLGVVALSAAREYAQAQPAIRRIASGMARESIAISRTVSRAHETNSRHAA